MGKKITGFSIGGGVGGFSVNGGVSWENLADPKSIISGLFAFLEARRLLINPTEMEIVDECINSALEIKQNLVDTAQKLASIKAHDDIELINAMIDASNQFLNELAKKERPTLIYKADGDTWEDKTFDKVMKTFRSGFRAVIKKFEMKYNLKFRKVIPYIF